MTHLWEDEHAYYCRGTAWNAGSDDLDTAVFETWSEFLDELGDSDMDYNLVFRWDWLEGEGEGHDLSGYSGDDYYRYARLRVFFMGQRKGLFWSREAKVCRADEAAIIAFLMPRMEHLFALWAPLREPAGGEEGL